MAKFSKAAYTDTQLFAGVGKSNPAYGMGARQLGGPHVRGREAHVQVREQNSGMMPAEDYRAAKFLPALWQDIDRNGAPYTMVGGALVGQAGVTDGTDSIAFVHQVMPANAGVPQALAYGSLDVGLTVDVDGENQDVSTGAFVDTDRVAAAGSSTVKVAGNKPLAYTPTNVIGTAWNDVFTNQKFDEPVTMKTQWLTMYPVDDLFMYGGSLAQNSSFVTIEVEDDLAGEFQFGEVVTETTSGATGTFRALIDGVMTLSLVSGSFTGGEVLTGGTSTATVTGDAATTSTDSNITDIQVDAATVGFDRSTLGFAPMVINAAGALALEGIQTGDKVMPNPFLPGKMISVSDFARCVMSEAGSGATGTDATSGVPLAVANWKASITGGAETEDTLTVADCLAYAMEHVVGTCFKRQTRATYNGNEFVGKDISTEIMSFFGQVPDLNLQGLTSDGFEADQEAARQFALAALANANTADVVFINFNIK